MFKHAPYPKIKLIKYLKELKKSIVFISTKENIRYNKDRFENAVGRGRCMKFILIMGVILAYLSAIWTAGYNDKSEVK